MGQERFGFFNSVDGDRKYNAAEFARYFGVLVSNGIFYKTANTLKVTCLSGMILSVSPGDAWINGYNYQIDEPKTITVPTGNGSNPRIDRAILRWDLPSRSIYLTIIQGVASASPTAPALTRDTDVYELCLAEIYVARAATNLTAANITDRRLDSSLCGEVNSLVRAVYD
jgi:hypothetical protein